MKASEWHRQQDEALRFISENRASLRALIVIRCAADSRLLGAVYKLPNATWLWYHGERLTPEETRRESLHMTVSECETMVEHRSDSKKAWERMLDLINSDQFHASTDRDNDPPKVHRFSSIDSCVDFYKQSSLEQIRRVDRDLRGVFTSCVKCRITYIIEFSAVEFALGKAASLKAKKPLGILPGKVVRAGAQPELAHAPVYGLINSWQATQWTLI